MTELAESSKKEYARIVKAIATAGYKDDDIASLKEYFDYEGEVNGKKKHKYCIRSRRVNVNACIHKHKTNDAYCAVLKLYLKQLTTELLKLTEDQKMTAKQEEKHLEWDKVLEKAMTAVNDEKYTLQDRILVGLYTQLEPVRVDYTHMKLYDSDPKLDKGTYFIINDEVKQVVINEHKTGCKYGAIRQPLPERLAEMITMWFKDEDVMFPISPARMGQRIKKLFLKVTGKPMTVCALRHSRDTFLYKDCPMPKELKRVAKAMGHSPAEAQTYRYAPK
jgi:hypothetical protein